MYPDLCVSVCALRMSYAIFALASVPIYELRYRLHCDSFRVFILTPLSVRLLIASEPKIRRFATGRACLNKVAPLHEHREVTTCRWRGDNDPSILNLGVERRLVVSFMGY